VNTRIAHVAFNTFREAVRDRVLYNLIAFALLLSGAAVLVGQISIDIERLVVVNLGLSAVSPWSQKRLRNARSTPCSLARYGVGNLSLASFLGSPGRWS
jgi:hypothetical protein